MSDALDDAERFDRAIAAIDEVNAEDPRVLVVDGVQRAKELVHADRMVHWLAVLDPAATDEQRLAARAHHLRRWVSPRDTYPEGRAGYHRWRSDQRSRHAHDVGLVLAEVGYDHATIERVQAIVAKQGLGRDPQVQAHEDALCLVFLELQLDEIAARLGDEQTVGVIGRTARKMSEAGLAVVAQVELSEQGHALVAEALAGSGD